MAPGRRGPAHPVCRPLRSDARHPHERPPASAAPDQGGLRDLAKIARQVRHSGTDRKWSELRETLNYLLARIRTLVGRDEAAVAIHGGIGREERPATQERFTQDPDVRVLVATDAAGEGLDLQRAHLMVNYDLPWNPNKVEQRFGRIHRIGQTEVCHVWNLVANNTREGEVFIRLLEKIEEQRKAYAGKVFDVLGDAFENQPLRTLLIKAIQYGDRGAVRTRPGDRRTRRRPPGP